MILRVRVRLSGSLSRACFLNEGRLELIRMLSNLTLDQLPDLSHGPRSIAGRLARSGNRGKRLGVPYTYYKSLEKLAFPTLLRFEPAGGTKRGTTRSGTRGTCSGSERPQSREQQNLKKSPSKTTEFLSFSFRAFLVGARRNRKARG